MAESKNYRVLATYKSRSRPGTTYQVVEDKKSGQVTCTCPDFTYRKKCWHRERQVDRICDRGYYL